MDSLKINEKRGIILLRLYEVYIENLSRNLQKQIMLLDDRMKKRSNEITHFKRLWVRKTVRITEVVKAYEYYDYGFLDTLKKNEPDEEEGDIIVSYWASSDRVDEKGNPLGITHYGWIWNKDEKWSEGDIYTDPTDSWRFIYFTEAVEA